MHTLVAAAANVAQKPPAALANSWSGSRKSPCELVVWTVYTRGGQVDLANETGPSFGDAVGWPQRLAGNVDVA